MNHIKRLTLTAAACAAIAIPLSAAQAQTGYDYLFWPLFTATPAPARIQAPAPIPAPLAAPRHAQTDYIHNTAAEISYARAPEIARPAFVLNPQSVMIGVGY
jgi:hypothetical protein